MSDLENDIVAEGYVDDEDILEDDHFVEEEEPVVEGGEDLENGKSEENGKNEENEDVKKSDDVGIDGWEDDQMDLENDLEELSGAEKDQNVQEKKVKKKKKKKKKKVIRYVRPPFAVSGNEKFSIPEYNALYDPSLQYYFQKSPTTLRNLKTQKLIDGKGRILNQKELAEYRRIQRAKEKERREKEKREQIDREFKERLRQAQLLEQQELERRRQLVAQRRTDAEPRLMRMEQTLLNSRLSQSPEQPYEENLSPKKRRRSPNKRGRKRSPNKARSPKKESSKNGSLKSESKDNAVAETNEEPMTPINDAFDDDDLEMDEFADEVAEQSSDRELRFKLYTAEGFKSPDNSVTFTGDAEADVNPIAVGDQEFPGYDWVFTSEGQILHPRTKRFMTSQDGKLVLAKEDSESNQKWLLQGNTFVSPTGEKCSLSEEDGGVLLVDFSYGLGEYVMKIGLTGEPDHLLSFDAAEDKAPIKLLSSQEEKPSHKWKFNEDGSILNIETNMALTIDDDSSLIATEFDNQDHQKWKFNGSQLVSFSSKSFSLPGQGTVYFKIQKE